MGLLLTGGLVVDGSGGPAYHGDVAIDAGTITALGPVGSVGSNRAGRTVDARGKVVCPGFVDLHTHSDLTILSAPSARSKLHQGVTTEVVGNCGLGVAPRPGGPDSRALRDAVSYLDLDPSLAWTWTDTKGYLAQVAAARPSLNVATLTGHIPLRAAVVGFDDRTATDAETAQMCHLLDQSLADGALGLSTGLAYPPACYAHHDELIALATTVAARDGLFAWHLRSYDDDLIASLRQALQVTRETGCRTQISHLTAVGSRNWGTVTQALDLIQRARAAGLDVGTDIYPYLHGNAPLTQLLPPWAQEGGADALGERLCREPVRRRIRQAWQNRPLTWDDVAVSRLPDTAEQDLAGKTITEVAAHLRRGADDVVLDLLAAHPTGVLVTAGGRSPDDLRAVLGHPACVVASDGLCLDPDTVLGSGLAHPRSYGCFPRYLSGHVDGSDAALADAVRRCTAAPAARIGLDRGALQPGAAADVVVLDPRELSDLATIADPHRFPVGIDLVIVNGEPVVEAGTHTTARPGAVLSTRKDQR